MPIKFNWFSEYMCFSVAKNSISTSQFKVVQVIGIILTFHKEPAKVALDCDWEQIIESPWLKCVINLIGSRCKRNFALPANSINVKAFVEAKHAVIPKTLFDSTWSTTWIFFLSKQRKEHFRYFYCGARMLWIKGFLFTLFKSHMSYLPVLLKSCFTERFSFSYIYASIKGMKEIFPHHFFSSSFPAENFLHPIFVLLPFVAHF